MKCPTCHREILNRAKTCPYCKESLVTSGRLFRVLFILAMIITGVCWLQWGRHSEANQDNPLSFERISQTESCGESFDFLERGFAKEAIPGLQSCASGPVGKIARLGLVQARAMMRDYPDMVKEIEILSDAKGSDGEFQNAFAQTLRKIAVMKSLRRWEGRLEFFRLANRVDSDSRNIMIGLIESLMTAEEFREASGHCAMLLRKHPGALQGARLCAEVKEKAGNLSGALSLWRRIAKVNPSDAGVKGKVEALVKELAERTDLQKEESAHFDLRYEGEEGRSYKNRILEALEEAREELCSGLDYYPVTRMETVIFSDERFSTRSPMPQWAEASFDGKLRLPLRTLRRWPDSKSVVVHELTHAFLREMTGGRMPNWFNEGLAMFFDGTTARDSLLKKGLPTLKSLEGSFMNANTEEAERLYFASYALTRFLLEERGLGGIQAFLRSTQRGENWRTAFAENFGRSSAELYDALKRKLRRDYGQ